MSRRRRGSRYVLHAERMRYNDNPPASMGRLLRFAGQKPTPSPPASQDASPIARDLVDEELRRILSSQPFTQAERLRRLLQFVVDATLSGRREELKEYSLGVAVFDRGPSFDPRTDPIVRVEAGRLRTRLNEYYSTVGAQDPILIDLPKGRYSITVQTRRTGPPAQSRRAFSRVFTWKMAALLACLGVIALLVQNLSLRQQIDTRRRQALLPPEVTALWGPFLRQTPETIIVFGSPMFFESEQKKMYVRPYGLNDPADLRHRPEFLSLQRLLGPLSDPQYAYAEIGDALALARLASFFGSYGKTAKAIPANMATWEAVKESNTVFIGPARLIPLLRRLPVQLDFDVQPDLLVTNRNPQPGEEKVYSTPSHTDALSYTLIATSPGLRPDRTILIITAHGSAGIEAGVEYATGLETLRELRRRLQPKPGEQRYYQILLRVLADKDQAFKTEYLTHHTALPPLAP